MSRGIGHGIAGDGDRGQAGGVVSAGVRGVAMGRHSHPVDRRSGNQVVADKDPALIGTLVVDDQLGADEFVVLYRGAGAVDMVHEHVELMV